MSHCHTPPTNGYITVVSMLPLFAWEDVRVSCLDKSPRQYDTVNLVDPASSHMLVSKIKPCMSKYKFFTAKL